MSNLEQILFNLIEPMVSDSTKVSVKTMPSLNENEVLLYVYADKEDVARLIGRQGSMASAIRQMMGIASHIDNKKITIKFESF